MPGTPSLDERKLVSAFIDYLQHKIQSDATPDQAESLEVAVQCLQSVFSVDLDDPAVKPKRRLLDVFVESQKVKAQEPTEEEKAKAEVLKNEGNELMKQNKFHEAVQKYDEAILLSQNPVFYCNRAAAYSKLEKHDFAIDDCRQALERDPTYSKAFGRMGLAYSCLNKNKEARDCYKRALELDPGNESFQNNLEISESKIAQEAEASSRPNTNAAPGAGFNPFGGGGMPDISNLLSNPALMNMATQMMADPNLQNMLFSMAGTAANQPGGGQGINALLEVGQRLASQMQQQNPDLVEQLRRQFQGGQGGGGGNNENRGGGGSGSNDGASS